MKAFVIGFPKAGTTTLHTALEKSGLRSAHWRTAEAFVGRLMYRGYLKSGDPFARLSEFDCVTQADVCIPQQRVNCWPNLDFRIISRIRESHEECVFLLNTRQVDKHIASIRGWNDLHSRLVEADVPGLPHGFGETDAELEQWIEGHYAACRGFFGDDPRFVEFDIADENAPSLLESALDISVAWWGAANRRPEEAAG